jgi:ferredoxin
MRRLKIIEALLRWKGYPDVFRIPMFIGFIYLLYVLLFGNQDGNRNLGLSVMWVVLWTLQPVVFILLGRFWCGICPFSTAGNLVQQITGNEIHLPLVIKKYGAWFAYAFFMVILITETLVHMSSSTSASTILLLTITIMAMLSGAFFKRRSWCRYLCPLGVTGGVFSRLRVIKLHKDGQICNECKDYECFQGTEKLKGCPMGLSVKSHDLDADCISCGNCLKNCPHGSPQLLLHAPAKGFLSRIKMSPSEAVFTSSFIGFSLALYLIKDFQSEFIRGITAIHHSGYQLLVLVASAGISLLLFYLFTYLISPVSGKTQRHNFMFFGFFLIPTIFFALLNLTSFHEVLMNGMTLYHNVVRASGLSLPVFPYRSLVSWPTLHFIQWLGVLAGSSISLAFCYQELQKVQSSDQSHQVIAMFGIFMLITTGFSLYILLFL